MRPSHRFDLFSALPVPFRARHWGPAALPAPPIAVEIQDRLLEDAIILRSHARSATRRRRPLTRVQEAAIVAALVASAIAIQITFVLTLSTLG